MANYLYKKEGGGMMAHIYNPSYWEAEIGRMVV
jgi:hypothetical protein